MMKTGDIMKKIVKYTFCVILYVILLSACKEEVKVDNKNADGTGVEQVKDEDNQEIENSTPDDVQLDEKVTMEYVCSEFGIDESEFEGLDFEVFVDYYDLSYDTIHKEAVAYLLKRYKENYGKPRIPDYRVTLSNLESAELTKENVNSIDIVYFSQINGEEHNFYIVDFDIGQIIEGSGSESMVSYDDIVGEANEQTKKKTIELFDKYDAYSWEQSDKLSPPIDIANGEVGTECRWYLKIRFNNGTIYRIYGDTLTDETAPENFDLFVEDLKALAASSATENP